MSALQQRRATVAVDPAIAAFEAAEENRIALARAIEREAMLLDVKHSLFEPNSEKNSHIIARLLDAGYLTQRLVGVQSAGARYRVTPAGYKAAGVPVPLWVAE